MLKLDQNVWEIHIIYIRQFFLKVIPKNQETNLIYSILHAKII